MARNSGPRKSKTDRAAVEVERKRERIAKLYHRGLSMREIGLDSKVKLNAGNVCRQLQALREEWKERYAGYYDERTRAELAKLDHLEATAWSEYERSREDAVRKTVEAAGDEKAKGKAAPTRAKKARQVTVTEGRCGDPRYLSIVESLIDKRLKLIGAYAPTKIAPTTPDGTQALNPYAGKPLDELMKLAAEADLAAKE